MDVIISKGVILATGDGEKKLETGHDIINQTTMTDNEYPSIVFNGYRYGNEGDDESYETFELDFDGTWNFCKTARLPYDLAVKCILMLAEKYDLLAVDKDDGTKWSFDGNDEDEEYKAASEIMTVFNIKHSK